MQSQSVTRDTIYDPDCNAVQRGNYDSDMKKIAPASYPVICNSSLDPLMPPRSQSRRNRKSNNNHSEVPSNLADLEILNSDDDDDSHVSLDKFLQRSYISQDHHTVLDYPGQLGKLTKSSSSLLLPSTRSHSRFELFPMNDPMITNSAPAAGRSFEANSWNNAKRENQRFHHTPSRKSSTTSRQDSNSSCRGLRLHRNPNHVPKSLIPSRDPFPLLHRGSNCISNYHPHPSSAHMTTSNTSDNREPENDITASHKLISNFHLNPMTVSERLLLSTTYARSNWSGSWNALDPFYSQPRASYSSSRIYDKGVVDIHDFRALRVIGKGSYGKVYLVENKHWSKGRTGPASNGPLSESSILRDTLSFMSSRKWHRSSRSVPKKMGIDEGCHRLYAMKVLNRETVTKKQQVEHTMTENHVLQFLKHPMIIDMHFAFKTPTKLFMCLEYCPGGELFHHLSAVGKFSEQKTKFYAGCILLALEYMHSKGVVYRDLKPENIVMDRTGYIRLTDFGLAKANIRDNHSAKSVCGTPEYLAPEVLMARGHGLSVDHWGLAALIYEMLTGLPPFYSKKREELLEGIRKGVLTYPDHIRPVTKDFLQRLFVKDPKNRLGAHNINEIKNHEFFHDVDFEGLINKTVPPPFVPSINNVFDTSNFDTEFTNLTLENFDEEDCVNPLIEDPNVDLVREKDEFYDWYYDKRYPDHYS